MATAVEALPSTEVGVEAGPASLSGTTSWTQDQLQVWQEWHRDVLHDGELAFTMDGRTWRYTGEHPTPRPFLLPPLACVVDHDLIEAVDDA
jgi:hypothetical protein